MYRTVRPVTICYSEIKDKERDLSDKIDEAFGPKGLGIISISDVPEFSFLRKSLLHLSAMYSFGWSYGKEKFESGKLDAFKGSFYANPTLDVPTTDVSDMQRYPLYCRPNKWPTSSLPELEVAFKALGKLILDVGLMLAYHCDKCVEVDEDEGLEKIIKRSRCHKARLLYYSPKQHRLLCSECVDDNNSISSWAGWHTDFSCLTGLTCGMFTRNAEEIECPDSIAGLYVKTRNDEIAKVFFGGDELAYQIGETYEIISGGRLCATPHCVRAPSPDMACWCGTLNLCYVHAT